MGDEADQHTLVWSRGPVLRATMRTVCTNAVRGIISERRDGRFREWVATGFHIRPKR